MSTAPPLPHSEAMPLADDDATTPGWIAARWLLFVIVDALIVVTALLAASDGSHNNMNAGVILGIGIALMPAGAYALGVRSRTSTLLAGAVLVVVTGVGWGLFLVGHREHADAGAFIIPAFFITLASSCAAVKRDGDRR